MSFLRSIDEPPCQYLERPLLAVCGRIVQHSILLGRKIRKFSRFSSTRCAFVIGAVGGMVELHFEDVDHRAGEVSLGGVGAKQNCSSGALHEQGGEQSDDR